MAYVEDGIVECFQKGGGLSYDDYNRFHEVMADESHQTVVTPLVDQLLPLAEGVKEKLEQGIEVLDVGCGSGKALIELAKEYPNSRFTGYDSSKDVVGQAIQEASKNQLANLTFVVQNAADFDDKETFDLILTLDSVHDQAKPDMMLQNIFNALKPDGTYFCQDIAGSSYVEKNLEHPIAPFPVHHLLHPLYECFIRARRSAGLGAMWGKELACQMMRDAGFSQVEVKNLEHDFINNYYIIRK